MNGRQENDRKKEMKIISIIKQSYPIITDYYYSLTDKTSTTKYVYIQRIIKYLDYINYNNDTSIFSDLKPSDINKYMESIRYDDKGEEKSVSARCGELYAISNFFDFLEIEGYISENICRKVKAPKITEEKEIVAMTIEEVEEVENNIKKWSKRQWRNRDLLLFVLGCTTGLRVSSIQEINVNDIDIKQKTILVTEKGNKVRSVNLGDKTVDYLRLWLEDRKKILGEDKTDALFISNRKSRMSVSTIRRTIEYYTSSLDKKITPHKMRSTCATNLYGITGDIYLVKDFLGHKNIANTMKYAQMSEEKNKEAAKLLDNII